MQKSNKKSPMSKLYNKYYNYKKAWLRFYQSNKQIDWFTAWLRYFSCERRVAPQQDKFVFSAVVAWSEHPDACRSW